MSISFAINAIIYEDISRREEQTTKVMTGGINILFSVWKTSIYGIRSLYI